MLLLVGSLEKRACSRPDKGVLGWFDLEAMEPTGTSLPAHGAMKVRVAKSMLDSSTKCLKGEIRAETKRATSTWGAVRDVSGYTRLVIAYKYIPSW